MVLTLKVAWAVCAFQVLFDQQVKNRVHTEIAKLMAWSFSLLQTGTFPSKGFYNEEVSPTSWRRAQSGKPLANGFRCHIHNSRFWRFISDPCKMFLLNRCLQALHNLNRLAQGVLLWFPRGRQSKTRVPLLSKPLQCHQVLCLLEPSFVLLL